MNQIPRLKWLEIQLEREDLSDTTFYQYNNEANALQDEINQVKLHRLADAQYEMQAKITHITSLVNEGRMVELVETYGVEFECDYSILENFTVISYCFNSRNPNGTNCWEHTSLKDALAKKFQLIYWRVYDRYIRNKGE